MTEAGRSNALPRDAAAAADPVKILASDGLPDPLRPLRDMMSGGPETRGQSKLVYVPTRLEHELLPHLRANPPTLVILSGNAGDGKTAFLEGVLTQYPGTPVGGTSETIGDKGGNEFITSIDGRPYRIVLDGSEDAEGRTNFELLHDAFSVFEGAAPVDDPERGTIVAINKGRLLRFAGDHQAQYPFLWSLATATFLGQGSVPASRYLLIDLNERSLIGPSYEESLFTAILQKMIDLPSWDDCRTCPAQLNCVPRRNVDLLREAPDGAGHEPRRQLWSVYAAADLDDRLHITARHVVASLAALVSGGANCAEIRASVARDEQQDRSAFLYNAVFAQHDQADESSTALEQVLATYDPTEREAAKQGRQTHVLVAEDRIAEIVPEIAGQMETYFSEDSKRIRALRIEKGPDPGAPEAEYRRQVLALTKAIGRRLFFTAPGHPAAPQLTLRTFAEFLELAGSPGLLPRDVAESLVKGLNAALGVETGAGRPTGRPLELLVPRDYTAGLRGRGFVMLIPADKVTVTAGTAVGHVYEPNLFLEGWGRSLIVAVRDLASERPVATLAVPLLLYEVLDRARRGFRPATQLERAYMVRLHSFYRSIAHYRWSVERDYSLYANGTLLARAVVQPGQKFRLEELE